MDKANVIWVSYHQPEILARGYWDQAILEETFNKGNFVHHDGFSSFANNQKAEDAEASMPGAVIVINGRTHIEDTERLNADIASLRWCLLIITGDEETLFPWREVHHPLMRVWVQLPRMNEHNDTSFKLINGYRTGTAQVLKELGPQQRTLAWFFAGQVNHDRREQCIAVLRQFAPLYPNQTIATDGFGKEVVNFDGYLRGLASAKVAPCPSGIETPDTFRVYEALEAGCIPVVDAFSTRNQAPGFWEYIFGKDIPFPIIDYWDKFPAVLDQLLKEYPANANRVSAWWQLKKRELFWRLVDDVKELSK